MKRSIKKNLKTNPDHFVKIGETTMNIFLKSIISSFILISSFYAHSKSALTRLKQNSAITYEQGGGRLGDQMIMYSIAQWFAVKYDIPLLYYPFDDSDKLYLHKEHRKAKSLLARHISQYQENVLVRPKTALKPNNRTSTLYITRLATTKDEIKNIDSLFK